MVADFDHLAWLNRLQYLSTCRKIGAQILQAIRASPHNHNGDAPTGHVLLILDSFVDGDQHIKKGIGQGQEFTVLDAGPAHLLSGRTLVSTSEEKGFEFFRSALIQQEFQNLHE
jgi:hypothetical protein